MILSTLPNVATKLKGTKSYPLLVLDSKLREFTLALRRKHPNLAGTMIPFIGQNLSYDYLISCVFCVKK